MSLILSVWVEGDPVAQPRARAVAFGGRARMYDPGTAKPWRQRIAAAVAPLRPEKPVEGPLFLELVFMFRRPKSHLRASGELKPNAPTYVTSRPDWDNLGKAVSDELTQLSVWQDDAQVAQVDLQKRYVVGSERPGMHLRLFRLA